MKTIADIEMIAEEARSIKQVIPGMIDGLSRCVDESLNTDGIITKVTIDSMNEKFQSAITNLVPYAKDILGITRSIAKPRKDGSRLEVPAPLMDDLKAYRGDISAAIANIKYIAKSFRKRVNLHNMALGDFENLVELDPGVQKEKKNSVGKKGGDPQDTAEPAAAIIEDAATPAAG